MKSQPNRRQRVYKSQFEEVIHKQCPDMLYEPLRFQYMWLRTYTPDFVCPNGLFIEAKGRFYPETRRILMSVKKTYPDMDIRLLLQSPHRNVMNGSKPTKWQYWEWCEVKGFKWAKGPRIPPKWLEEPNMNQRYIRMLEAGINTIILPNLPDSA